MNNYINGAIESFSYLRCGFRTHFEQAVNVLDKLCNECIKLRSARQLKLTSLHYIHMLLSFFYSLLNDCPVSSDFE